MLLDETGDRAAESLITKGVADLSLSVPDPGASSGATTPASTSPGDAAAPAATTGASAQDMGSMVEGAGDRALVNLPLKQHVNREVCRTEQGQDARILSWRSCFLGVGPGFRSLSTSINRQSHHTLYWVLAGSHSSCLLYTSPSPRDQRGSRMPYSA